MVQTHPVLRHNISNITFQTTRQKLILHLVQLPNLKAHLKFAFEFSNWTFQSLAFQNKSEIQENNLDRAKIM